MKLRLLIILFLLCSYPIKSGVWAQDQKEPATKTIEANKDDDFVYNAEDYDGEEEAKDPDIERLLKNPIDLMSTTPLRLRLEDCIRLALEHNSKLQATGYNIDAAKAQLMEASAGGWPVVDYEYRTAPVPKDVKHAMESLLSGEVAWWNRIKLGIGVPLYTFGKLSLAQEMARSGVHAAEIQAFQEKNSLVARVRQLYYGVLLAEEVGRLLTEAHNRLQEEIAKRETSPDDDQANAHSPLETLKLKVTVFDVDKRLAEARQKSEMALEALRIQMGLAPGTVFTVFSNKLRPVVSELSSYDDYVKVALNKRPDVKLLETGLNVKKNQYLLEKRKWFPDVGLGFYFEMGRTLGNQTNITVTDDFNDPFSFTRAGLGLQVSGKFDPHGSAARMDKARSEYYKLNLEQMIAKEGIRLDVKDAYLKAKTAQIALKQAQEAEKTARQLLFLTQSNYDIGVGEQKDMVDALQTVMMTRSRYFEAVFEYNASLANLDEKIGTIPEVTE